MIVIKKTGYQNFTLEPILCILGSIKNSVLLTMKTEKPLDQLLMIKNLSLFLWTVSQLNRNFSGSKEIDHTLIYFMFHLGIYLDICQFGSKNQNRI